MLKNGQKKAVIHTIASLAPIVFFVVWSALFGGWSLAKKLSGCVVIIVWAAADIYMYQDKAAWEKKFSQYVAAYQLTPEQLSDVTGFSRYDFSRDKKGRMLFVFCASPKKRQQVLSCLEDVFGPV